MREIIDRLRGDKSFMEFAQACNMSQSWLYKIAQGEIKKPLPKDFVMKMINNAENKVTYEEYRKREEQILNGEHWAEKPIERVRSKVVEKALLDGATVALGDEPETSAWDFCLVVNSKKNFYKAYSPKGDLTLDTEYLMYTVGCWVCSKDSRKNILTIAVLGDSGDIEKRFSDMNENVNVKFTFIEG